MEATVVIPTHNRPEMACRAIASVEEQGASIAELIVVNDGSDADYGRVRARLDEVSVPTTHYLKTDGVGAAGARNRGAAKATSEVLMFLDDDDRWRVDKARRQLDRFTSGVAIVYSGRVAVSESGDALYEIDSNSTGDLSRAILIRNLIGTTSGPAIRRDLFDAVGGFDEDMPGLQDWELWMRLCQWGDVEYDPANTVEWMVHDNPTGQMTGEHERYIEAVKRLREKHADRFAELSWTDRRRARASQLQSIASKAGADPIARGQYALKSLSYWPTVSAGGTLLPERVVRRIR